MAALTCSSCGQVITGKGRIFNTKTYCASCYQKVLQEQEALAEEKRELCLYIRKMFGINQVPNETMYAIDKFFKEGKKYKGMQATLYYYFEILGNDGVNIMMFSRIINEQYENARNYLERVNKIKRLNADREISDEVVTYVISDKNKNKRKPQRRIEDL